MGWKKTWQEQWDRFLRIFPILFFHCLICLFWVATARAVEFAVEWNGHDRDKVFGVVPWRYVFQGGDLFALIILIYNVLVDLVKESRKKSASAEEE